MELKGNRVTIVGAARSGMAAARLLCSRGAHVTITDLNSEKGLSEKIGCLKELPISWRLGGHPLDVFLDADLVVLSPGVPPAIEPLEEARRNRVPIISEIELASWFIASPIIAVTGTNGKTTTTDLIGRMLSRWGKNVFVGGNIGKPLSDCVLEAPAADFVVAEVSSFQLEGIRSFRPNAALLLNLCEDHLDRYPSFEDYVSAKARLFMNQGQKDFAVLNAEDQKVMEIAARLRSRIFTFCFNDARCCSAFIQDHHVVFKGMKETERIPLEGIGLKGRHNLKNVMAAALTARVYGCPATVIREVLQEVKGYEHRMEYVASFQGISFYNDSKATNVGAVIESLESFQEPVVLICGGKDKGIDYAVLRDSARRHVKLLVLLGEARDKIARALESTAPIVMVSSMEEGVQKAVEAAERNDVVLLSPACASFDMYQDYEERGRDFKRIVCQLVGQRKT